MDTIQLWQLILSEIELSVTKAVYATFFARTQLISLESAVATIGCDTPVSRQMIETRYYALCKSLIDKHTKANVSLLFKVVSNSKLAHKEKHGPTAAVEPLFNLPSAATPFQVAKSMRLRADYTFESFAVSTSNHMAYAAATAVAQSPGTSYNPLFFYGGVGVGKTHLMQAIGNAVLFKKPDTRIIYCMGEEFTNEIIDAIQLKTTRRFKDKYRTAQMLLIDDIQFIAGKNAVQEEFFHTFNALQREGGQIVLTSDRPPHEIDRIEDRLRSRFEGGLLIDVQNPDFELRCAILRIKAQQKGVDLPISLAQILAANCEEVRQLEGLLTRVLGESQLRQLPLTEELAIRIVSQVTAKPVLNITTNLAQLPRDEKRRIVTPKQVTEAVIRRFGVTFGQLKGIKRDRPIARPRQVLMYLLRTELQLPFDEVGSWVGGRDHTTVMHAVQTITNLLSTNDLLRDDVSWIKKELFG